MSEWHIVRPSPVHPWTVAIYENSRLIAEVTDDVATQIETLKREHAEAQANARVIGAAAAFWKAQYDAVVADRAETQAAIRAIVEKHAAAIAHVRSNFDAVPFPRPLVRWPIQWLDSLRRIALVAETKWWRLMRVGSRTGIDTMRRPNRAQRIRPQVAPEV